jgi:hypothetical protein
MKDYKIAQLCGDEVGLETGAEGLKVSRAALGHYGTTLLYGSLFRWVGTKRGEISAFFGAIAILDVLFGNAWPVDPFRPGSSPRFWIFWSLFLGGMVVRIWAAGVINKCKEVTRIGIYRLVRHPLYLGTLLIYLSFFLGLGNIFLGAALLFLMTLIVYYPRILQEEKLLLSKFPSAYRQYAGLTPRLIPRLSLIFAALRDGGFSMQKSYQNLGVKSLFGITLLPLLLEMLIKIKERF